MSKLNRIVYCSTCGMNVRGTRVYRRSRYIGRNNLLKNIYFCPLCGKMIRDMREVKK